MEFKIYKNASQCRNLWENFSPNQRLFDFWDFRQCFHNKSDGQLHFLAGKENGNVVGVAPLTYLKAKSCHSYFGGWFPERNYLFMKDKGRMNEFLEKCPDGTVIEGIDPEESRYYKFSDDEDTYYLDLSRYSNDFAKYFGSFDRKKQKNFRRDLKRIPRHKVYYNRLRDFKRLVELNVRQFDDDSIYSDDATRNAMEKMIKLAHRRKMLQMISMEINGKVEAVDVGILLGKWYHVVTGSSNNQKIPNIGKFITTLSIRNAILNRARYVDFLASSGYWKNLWGFDKEMLLKFEK